MSCFRRFALLATVCVLLGACGNTATIASKSSGDAADNAGGLGGTTAKAAATSMTGGKGRADVQVVEIGFSQRDSGGKIRATAAAILENNGTDAAKMFEVVFTFTDAGGKPVGTETDYVNIAPPGKRVVAGVETSSLQANAAAVAASAVIRSTSFGDPAEVPITVESVRGSGYEFSIAGTATNPSTKPLSMVLVACAVRAGGKIVGYRYTVADTIVPGGSVAWKTGLNGGGEGDTADCSASTT